MIKLAVSGCQGRMGQRIVELALKDPDFKITTLLENKNRPNVLTQLHQMPVHFDAGMLKGCDVLIEFTSPEATMEHLAACRKFGVKMVIGTTGLNPEQVARVEDASSQIAVVYSSNMSVGVNLVFGLIRQTAAVAKQNYTIRLSETHHVHKKDAPSGTAKTMAEIAEKTAGHKVEDIASVREGEVIGDHTIVFESPVDVISISHHAKTRDIFAEGSLVAAKFAASKSKGLFSMQDVLGL